MIESCFSDIEKLSESASSDLSRSSNTVDQFQRNYVEPAKMKVIRREELLKSVKDVTAAGAAGTAIAGTVGGGLVAAPILGGAGVIIIAGTAVPPVLIIGGCMLIGFVTIGAIGLGISKLLKKYRNHQTRSIKYLATLTQLCESMKSDAELMVKESDKLCTDSTAIKANITALRRSLHSKNQRRGHSNIYRQFKEQNEKLMTTLKNIMDFKIESAEEVNRELCGSNRHAIR